MTSPTTEQHVSDLSDYMDSSPTPYHAAANAAAKLDAAGFFEMREENAWAKVTGRRYLRRGGTLIAWNVAPAEDLDYCVKIVGAHTDSPNLRLKPNPDSGAHGFRQLGIEVYGGALYNSWLDRDLGVAGRLVVEENGSTRTELVRCDDIGIRVSQLAIHLDRDVNKGLTLNPQVHLSPIWGLGAAIPGGFVSELLERSGLSGLPVVAHDLMLFDSTPAAVLGVDGEFFASGRIDNLVSCHAGLAGFIGSEPSLGTVAMLALFDHEEVGSKSASGADGIVLATAIERILHGLGCDPDVRAAVLARSSCVSADCAHATHPNYPDHHDAAHHVSLDGGPVVKYNANARYATDSRSAAEFIQACSSVDVPVQRFVMRSDMACGSTIGPATASRLGVSTVDVGIAQLSMHSAREVCGTTDPARLASAVAAFIDS